MDSQLLIQLIHQILIRTYLKTHLIFTNYLEFKKIKLKNYKRNLKELNKKKLIKKKEKFKENNKNLKKTLELKLKRIGK